MVNNSIFAIAVMYYKPFSSLSVNKRADGIMQKLRELPGSKIEISEDAESGILKENYGCQYERRRTRWNFLWHQEAFESCK